jgi:hypothetical protein
MSVPATTIDPAELLRSPRLLLGDLDLPRGQARLVPMDEGGYRASAFLDARARRADPLDLLVPLSGLVRQVLAGAPAPRPVHYLFHSGHCGSTLVSRMLGELPGLFALREPPPLLLLAQIRRHLGRPGMGVTAEQWELLFRLVTALLARTWRAGERALVKPTSHANNLIPRLLGAHPDNRAVLLHLDFEAHLAVMTRPRNQPESEQALRDARWLDWCVLTGQPPSPPPPLDAGERAALVWLLQMTEMGEALQDPALAPRLLPLHFAQWRADPAAQLARCAEWFGAAPTPAQVEAVVQGPIPRTDAKDPAQAHDEAQHARELAATAAANAAAIERGRVFARQAVAQHPRLRAAWERFAAAPG